MSDTQTRTRTVKRGAVRYVTKTATPVTTGGGCVLVQAKPTAITAAKPAERKLRLVS